MTDKEMQVVNKAIRYVATTIGDYVTKHHIKDLRFDVDEIKDKDLDNGFRGLNLSDFRFGIEEEVKELLLEDEFSYNNIISNVSTIFNSGVHLYLAEIDRPKVKAESELESYVMHYPDGLPF